MQLVVATLMVALTVLIHLAGLAVLVAILRRHRQRVPREMLVHQAVAILVAAFGLFALHSVEIWSYAFLYWRLGAVAGFEDALYFSTVTYSTIGYGDIVLPRAWRILGAIEGANGIILLGWSTAFFISIVDRIKLVEREYEQL